MNELLCIVAWFLAGLVNGISGMGAAMVALPFLTVFMTPQEFVPISCIVVTVILSLVGGGQVSLQSNTCISNV